jgi:acetyltransferase-like isoleucine patch superfamily enzyme
MIKVLLKKIQFDRIVDRIGPDIPFTHWRLHFKPLMQKLCRKKFQYFGENAEFRPGAYAIACSKIRLGKNVVIRPGVMLFGDPRSEKVSITIEDDVLIGSGVHFYVGNHAFKNSNVPIIYQGHDDPKEVIVKKGSWIGANAIILPGVQIGENAVVGAGSVVTKSIPKGVLAAGNPAKIIKEIEL